MTERNDYYLLANARRICNSSFRSKPNWALVTELYGVGSTMAKKICIEAGVDPDAKTVRAASEVKG